MLERLPWRHTDRVRKLQQPSSAVSASSSCQRCRPATHPSKGHSNGQVSSILGFLALVNRYRPIDVQGDPDLSVLLGLVLSAIQVDGVSVNQDLAMCDAEGGVVVNNGCPAVKEMNHLRPGIFIGIKRCVDDDRVEYHIDPWLGSPR